MNRFVAALRSKWTPLVTALVVAIAGWLVYQRVAASLDRLLRDQLETVLEADVEALMLWVDQQRMAAERAAGDERVREHASALADLAADHASPSELLESKAQAGLRQALTPALGHGRFTDYVLLSPNGRTIAAYLTEQVGAEDLSRWPFVRKALSGDSAVSAPFPAFIALPNEHGIPIKGARTMFAAAPIRGSRDEVIGVIAFRIRPEVDFDRILQVGRMGETGETYAFDATGRLVSRSRFEDQLRKIGLLPPDPSVKSPIHIQIRDPGADLTQGNRTPPENQELPLTKMAAEAVAGKSGNDTVGYRDYRGVPVVGAWMWVPELDIGVTTEVDVAEAYQPLIVVQRSFRLLIGLLIAVAAANIVVSRRAARLEQRITEAEHLGQYALERKIGEGGMGAVYLARHALLQRPTAIKVLNRDSAGHEALERFEREVRATSGLSHPNTIAIYDFGRTPQGVFYYAMEFLEGVTLGRCVEVAGPLPEARLVHVLLQACGSLAEAHAEGLLHRDIKPANLMLCSRGGIFDFVKVLDFGLVRPVEQPDQLGLTNVNSLTGTPLFLSPELIQAPDHVDARSDVYQLGVVAYYLLTGVHVFEGANIFEVCAHHLYAEPEPPERRAGRSFSPDLSELILRCLEKDREKRPADARELLHALRECTVVGTWSQADARSWWERWSPELGAGPHGPASLPGSSLGTNPPTVRVDVGARVARAV
ncbi:MAG: serine/threonine protein kinase [Deltaproteobacteria bacterium]|nr:serine/threonine protein kinase [Deltaproteobacteria bacterium]